MHDRNRTKASGRSARYRARRRQGQFCVSVEVDAAVLDLLERLRWLDARDSHDAKTVAEAIRCLLELSAKI